jgi:hypothetical protein
MCMTLLVVAMALAMMVTSCAPIPCPGGPYGGDEHWCQRRGGNGGDGSASG